MHQWPPYCRPKRWKRKSQIHHIEPLHQGHCPTAPNPYHCTGKPERGQNQIHCHRFHTHQWPQYGHRKRWKRKTLSHHIQPLHQCRCPTAPNLNQCTGKLEHGPNLIHCHCSMEPQWPLYGRLKRWKPKIRIDHQKPLHQCHRPTGPNPNHCTDKPEHGQSHCHRFSKHQWPQCGHPKRWKLTILTNR